MKKDELKNAGIAKATASIFNEEYGQIMGNICGNFEFNWYYMGSEFYDTHNLDSLVSEGMVFTYAIFQSRIFKPGYGSGICHES